MMAQGGRGLRDVSRRTWGNRLAATGRALVRGLRGFARALERPRSVATPRPRVALAFGGGFARGLAHLGVLKILVENRIPIDALSGVSVGAVVAAAYASGMTLERMIREAREVRWRDIGRWTLNKRGLATNERLGEWIERVLPARRFEDLKLPLAVVATDLACGEAVVFRQGDLVLPLRASCTFPGLFAPIELDGRVLVDGALVASVPVTAAAELGAERVIAVHLRSRGPRKAPTNLFQVIGQAFEIAGRQNQATWRERASVVIEPDVTDFTWDDFDRADELIAIGEAAARAALPALRAMLEARSVP
jgi:NTE family protein